MARLLSLLWCLALLVALHQVAGSTTGRQDLEVICNQAPEAISGDTLTVDEGVRLSLTCSATGSPSRQVYWYEGTHELPSADRRDVVRGALSTTLTMDPVLASDDDRTLTCRVDSSTQYKKVTLKVKKFQHRGSSQMLISHNQDGADSPVEVAQVKMGSKLELTCTVHGIDPHPLSWWHGVAQLTTAVSDMERFTSTSTLTIDPVRATDHLQTFTCRADVSTMARSVMIQVLELQESRPEEGTSVMKVFGKHISLQALVIATVLFCGAILIISCFIIIKALQEYLKIHEQSIKKKQQPRGPLSSSSSSTSSPSSSPSSSSSSRSKGSQKKTPAMKQSLKNQILASTFGSGRARAPVAETHGADQREQDERLLLSPEQNGGQSNRNFVEEV